jgi:hypothetical protein
MKRLSHVAFAHPIPIPGTHERKADFSTHDGWSIEDDDGCIALSRGETKFYTYVSASCVEQTSGYDAPVRGPDAAPRGGSPAPSAGEGLGGAGINTRGKRRG